MKIGLTELALNAAKAAGRVGSQFMNSERILVSTELHQERMQICHGCSKFKNNRCGACGCYTTVKTKLQSESCPDKHW